MSHVYYHWFPCYMKKEGGQYLVDSADEVVADLDMIDSEMLDINRNNALLFKLCFSRALFSNFVRIYIEFHRLSKYFFGRTSIIFHPRQQSVNPFRISRLKD